MQHNKTDKDRRNQQNQKFDEIITPSTTCCDPIEEKMSVQIQVKDIRTATELDDIDRDSLSDSNESIHL